MLRQFFDLLPGKGNRTIFFVVLTGVLAELEAQGVALPRWAKIASAVLAGVYLRLSQIPPTPEVPK